MFLATITYLLIQHGVLLVMARLQCPFIVEHVEQTVGDHFAALLLGVVDQRTQPVGQNEADQCRFAAVRLGVVEGVEKRRFRRI